MFERYSKFDHTSLEQPADAQHPFGANDEFMHVEKELPRASDETMRFESPLAAPPPLLA